MPLHIYMGPMFSGKTSQLIIDYRADTRQNKFIIDYDFSTPENINREVEPPQDYIVSRDNYSEPGAYNTNLLSHCYYTIYKLRHRPLGDDTEVSVYINEAQFFPDLSRIVKCLLSTPWVHVYLYGLDANYIQEPFMELMKLIPFATTVKKLNGLCSHCNQSPSVFSCRCDRFTRDNNNEIVQGDAGYEPLCSKCGWDSGYVC